MAIEVLPGAAGADLETRPRAETFTVERLLGLVRRGKVRIPDFQRRLRWDSGDRLSLFESMFLGYPIGAVLLWKRPSPAQRVSFRDLHIDAPEVTDGLWIVDGQQRVATIASELLASENRSEPRAIFFDVDQRKFVEQSSSSSRPKLVPLRLVLDAAVLSEWVLDNELSRAERMVVFELGKRLREFEIPSYIVETDRDAVLRQIFKRINSTGKSLEEFEVFDALVGSTLAHGGIGELNQRLAHLHFGALNEEEVLHRSFEAVSDLPLGRKQSASLGPEVASDNLRKTERALIMAIEFLRTDAGIPHADLLPYSLPVVVLAKFFALFPEASRMARRRLRRWLWRASLDGALGGASGTLEQFVRKVHDDEHSSISRLMEDFCEPSIEPFRLSHPLSRASARGKLELCALVALRPRDPATGDVFDVQTLFERGADGAVRRLVGKASAREDAADVVQTLADRVLSPRKLTLRELCSASESSVRESHAIDAAALDAANAGDLAGVLAARHRFLARWARAWFERMGDFETRDVPPVSALRLVEKTS
jgi:hypothetical protein